MAKTLPINTKVRRAKKRPKQNRYKRNHKQPIPAMHENPLYTKLSGSPALTGEVVHA